jgi:FtsH-binding integral membrane protein
MPGRCRKYPEQGQLREACQPVGTLLVLVLVVEKAARHINMVVPYALIVVFAVVAAVCLGVLLAVVLTDDVLLVCAVVLVCVVVYALVMRRAGR